jgi:hypothetical protein
MSSHGGGGRSTSSRSRSRSRRGTSASASAGSSPASAIPVAYSSDRARARLERLVGLGRSLTDAEVAGLAGAVAVASGSHVTVDDVYVHGTGPGGRTLVVYVSRDDPAEGGGLVLSDWQFTNRAGAEVRFDPRVIAAQVRGASALGVERIHVKARSFSRDDTQLTRIGFDVDIATALREIGPHAQLPPQFAGARTLAELQSMRGGTRWWRANLRGKPPLFFDLRPGSASRAQLDAYLRAHNLPPL